MIGIVKRNIGEIGDLEVHRGGKALLGEPKEPRIAGLGAQASGDAENIESRIHTYSSSFEISAVKRRLSMRKANHKRG